MNGLALSVCMLFMSSSFISSMPPAPPAAVMSSQAALAPEESEFVRLTNETRLKSGLHELSVDPALVQAARNHSREMAERAYFSHESPSPELRTPMKRYLKALGSVPDYAMVGENLFYCSRVDVQLGQKSLMASLPHRQNILEPRYQRIGIGVWEDPSGGFYVTEMFLSCTPE